tara:strand:+ start:166 stop:690 length:525 start_codon:yes stop_codon:yes gene_type:complete
MWRQRHVLTFIHNDRGVAATEFALILPLLIVLLIGTVELGNVLLVDKKVTAASQTAADLIAQQKVVTRTDLDNIWLAMDNILAPFSADKTRYVALSVVSDSAGRMTIDWHSTRSVTGSIPITIPPGLLGPNESIIVSGIFYDYTPVFDDFLFAAFTISDFSYLRPRTVNAVEFR